MVMIDEVEQDWWVSLRCASGKTTQLVEKLCFMGVEAWTPIKLVNRRVPRKRVKQKVVVPMLPSFVFIPAGSLDAAQEYADMRTCPAFNPMFFMGRLARFKGDQLLPMRVLFNDVANEEEKFPDVGTTVTLRFGAFSGLRGTVVGRVKQQSLVELQGSSMVVKIAPFFLEKTAL
jgi:hypothetical protein